MKSEANETHVFNTVQLQKTLFFPEDYDENVRHVFTIPTIGFQTLKVRGYCIWMVYPNSHKKRTKLRK